MNEFARRLKEFRRQKGLTQKAFGELVGVPQPTVSKWEKGLQQPSVGRFPKVAAELGDFLPPLGFEEESQLDFKSSGQSSGLSKPAKRHPLFGSMKGTTILAPGTDLTKPALQTTDLGDREPGRHPAFGALKGMITLLPDVDYTEPADPDWGKVYED